jgi:hypothetical protein
MGRPLKAPRLLRHLETNPNLREQLRTQGEFDRVLAAATSSDGRLELCQKLELSWPSARRYLWQHRAKIVEYVERLLQQRRRELRRDFSALDFAATKTRQAEIARLKDLWVCRYLNQQSAVRNS